MSVDVEGLRSTIRSIRQQIARQQIVGLDEDVDRLERIADAAESRSSSSVHSGIRDLQLPPEIVRPSPDAVADFVRAHPGMADLVRDMAAALIEEFRCERSEIVLDTEDDDYVDETDLVFTIRVANYDDSFMNRLHRIEEQYDDQLAHISGSVYVTTDHVPAE